MSLHDRSDSVEPVCEFVNIQKIPHIKIPLERSPTLFLCFLAGILSSTLQLLAALFFVFRLYFPWGFGAKARVTTGLIGNFYRFCSNTGKMLEKTHFARPIPPQENHFFPSKEPRIEKSDFFLSSKFS